jgi:hypothetical protein
VRYRNFIYATISILLSSLAWLTIAEIVLRFLPVSTGLAPVSVTPADPAFHFTPNREFVFSRGWNFRMLNTGRINNDGWVNDQDYESDGPTPVVAVVGDSYIEAAMVPYSQTAQGRLADALTGRSRVYSFAASGAPLSQYLIWAEYAVRKYRAKFLIINVVGNDFDESHVAYKAAPGFWHYAPNADGKLQLRLFEFHRTAFWSIVHSSALARYLFINLELGQYLFSLPRIVDLFFGGPAHPEPASAGYAGNTAAAADATRLKISDEVINTFFRDLPRMTGLSPDHVMFALDGFRYPDLAETEQGTYFDLMRRRFRQKGEALKYRVLDLDPYFFEHYRATGERVEFPLDGHWNGTGHAIVADAVLKSGFLSQVAARP